MKLAGGYYRDKEGKWCNDLGGRIYGDKYIKVLDRLEAVEKLQDRIDRAIGVLADYGAAGRQIVSALAILRGEDKPKTVEALMASEFQYGPRSSIGVLAQEIDKLRADLDKIRSEQ